MWLRITFHWNQVRNQMICDVCDWEEQSLINIVTHNAMKSGRENHALANLEVSAVGLFLCRSVSGTLSPQSLSMKPSPPGRAPSTSTRCSPLAEHLCCMSSLSESSPLCVWGPPQLVQSTNKQSNTFYLFVWPACLSPMSALKSQTSDCNNVNCT